MDDQPSPQTLARMGKDLILEQALVDGRWISGTGEPIAVDNPTDGDSLGHVPSLSEEAVEQAIAGAADLSGLGGAQGTDPRRNPVPLGGPG